MQEPLDLENPARTRVPVSELIRERWSTRLFTDRLPERDTLMALFEAARWAPSCFNEQPWSFLLATREQPDEHARLASCLMDANRVWAEKAPVLALSVASTRFARNGRDNAHAWHDVGLAISQLSLQATSQGLSVHQMAGYDAALAVELFAIPDDWTPVAAMAIGYPARVTSSERPERTRKEAGSFLFGGRWGQVHPLVRPRDDAD